MFTNSLFSIITCLALVFVALMESGCSSGDGKGKDSNPIDEIANELVVDARVSVASPFTATETVKEVPASFYTRGCKDSGKTGNADGFDTALRAGDIVKEVRSSSSNQGTWKSEVETRIRQAEKFALIIEETYLNFTIPGQDKVTAPTFIKTPHFVARRTLKKKEASDSYYTEDRETIENGINPEWLKQREALPAPAYYNCNIEASADRIVPANEQTISLGTARLLGKVIPAVEEKTVTKGEVVCKEDKKDAKEIKLGHGSQEWTNVQSNSLLGLSSYFCGGHSIYISSVLKLDDGRIVRSYANRIDSAPTAR